MKLIVALPISVLLAGCPPMIVPHFSTKSYEKIYSFPAEPRPWLTLESEGISLYLYNSCHDRSSDCKWQNLVALKSGTKPDWKILLDARPISWKVQGTNLPMRRPISAYVPGTKYRFMGAFDNYPEIVFAIPDDLVADKGNRDPGWGRRYRQIEDYNSLASPVAIDIQLVVYDDEHQWIFARQPKPDSRRKDYPTDLFVPSDLFRFSGGDDVRLHQSMALYYVSPKTAPIGYRVVSGKAAEYWVGNYNIKYRSHQIALADVTFPSAPLTLDALTVDDKSVTGKPTLLCHYSYTQFNLGWMDATPNIGPSEEDRKNCEPIQ
ncbi:hypothetical protein [Burkholderia lata]|uniref:hypothetical protein n=1 Tax=Burkholderia lata (strain ATCC 17760 / DSM 23089 / LMG 22485 / NCIMB 9086 / R18194 / 383) TaxID=482957 RepID=UPI001582BB58|nr:hypothetical protein [Burkholderia lata]